MTVSTVAPPQQKKMNIKENYFDFIIETYLHTMLFIFLFRLFHWGSFFSFPCKCILLYNVSHSKGTLRFFLFHNRPLLLTHTQKKIILMYPCAKYKR